MTDLRADRSYLSIGEVLDLLKDEFPDVTISKIRFLESRGLLDPERTPSGYRKFYDDDIRRLRWILTQQKEHFLPLKVIKGRLESGAVDEEPGAGPGGNDVQPTLPSLEPDTFAGSVVAELAENPGPLLPDPSAPASPQVAPPTDGAATSDRPRRRRPRRAPAPVTVEGEQTFEELVALTGALPDLVAQLIRFGLVSGRDIGGQQYYDADTVELVRVAAGLAGHGIEPRHLRGFKVSAEREAGLYEQVVLPLVRQRNPAAAAETRLLVEELGRLGGELRQAMLRRALRELADPR